jgi:hypothetical protein
LWLARNTGAVHANTAINGVRTHNGRVEWDLVRLFIVGRFSGPPPPDALNLGCRLVAIV